MQNSIFTENDANACTPEDMMNLNLGYDETNESVYGPDKSLINYGGYRNKSLHCDDECFRIDYLTKITSGNIDKDAMLTFVNKTKLDIDDPG